MLLIGNHQKFQIPLVGCEILSGLNAITTLQHLNTHKTRRRPQSTTIHLELFYGTEVDGVNFFSQW